MPTKIFPETTHLENNDSIPSIPNNDDNDSIPSIPNTVFKPFRKQILPHIFYFEGVGCKETSQLDKMTLINTINNINRGMGFPYIHSHDIEIICYTPKIKKNICDYKSLQNDTNVDIFVKKILDSARENDKVLVYGASFGGMIVNRITEILLERYKNETDETKKIIQKIHFATFGSIYINNNIDFIDIKNYIAIGDVQANTCTRGIKHLQALSDTNLKEENFTEMHYYGNIHKLAFKQREDGEKSIVDICFYKKNKDGKFVSKCNKNIAYFPILRISHEWKTYYIPLMQEMMLRNTTDINYLDKLYKMNYSYGGKTRRKNKNKKQRNITKVIREIPKEKYRNIIKGTYERPEKYVSKKNNTRKIKKNYL